MPSRADASFRNSYRRLGGTKGFSKASPATSFRMKLVRSKNTELEKRMEGILQEMKISFRRQPKLLGHPDFRITGTRILIFCDSSFWHGRRKQDLTGKSFGVNSKYWQRKLRSNRARDARVSAALRRSGWTVLRFWDTTLLKNPSYVRGRLSKAITASAESRPTAIDLFSGMGGLTLGLKRAGFRVVAAVEINKEHTKTYEANHPEVLVIEKDIREVKGKDILDACGLKSIDLVAGCPPCQGFSKLTDKYHKDDPRNDLVLEMARIVEEIKPKAVMMENVAGLAKRGKPKLDEFVEKLRLLGYIVNQQVLQLANYGVPQSRRRLVVLAGKGFKIEMPKETRAFRADKRKGLKPWLSLEDILPDLGKPMTLTKALKNGGPSEYNWHVVRDMREMTRKRLKAIKTGQARSSLPKRLRPECHKSYEGFENVYGRLSWKRTPPTITAGCTTFAKGRFGHPSQMRTISVREAASIQTFPQSYRVETDYMEAACDLIGNALPPRFAKLTAKQCLRAISGLGAISR